MGGTSYSAATHAAYTSSFAAKGTDSFDYDRTVRSSGRAVVHKDLDPKTPNKAGKIVRESFDSDAHPNSLPIVVLLDVTGSMNTVPKEVIQQLPKLMAALVKQGIPDPHVLFGAIGDAYSDRVPVQFGQFEAGNELDESLSKFFLEGGGGGQNTESYELGMYFLNKNSVLDSLNKRNKKGYLFILGDELPYKNVNRHQVEQHFGDILEADIPTDTILTQLREKYEVYWLIPDTYTGKDRVIREKLGQMFGERLINLDETEHLCATVAGIVGVNEGNDLDAVSDSLVSAGVDARTASAVTSALVPYAKGTSSLSKSTVTGDLVLAGTDDVERL